MTNGSKSSSALVRTRYTPCGWAACSRARDARSTSRCPASRRSASSWHSSLCRLANACTCDVAIGSSIASLWARRRDPAPTPVLVSTPGELCRRGPARVSPPTGPVELRRRVAFLDGCSGLEATSSSALRCGGDGRRNGEIGWGGKGLSERAVKSKMDPPIFFGSGRRGSSQLVSKRGNKIPGSALTDCA